MTVRLSTVSEQLAIEAMAASDPAVKEFVFLWRRWKNWESHPPIVVLDDSQESPVVVGFHAVSFGTRSRYANSMYQFVMPRMRGQRLGGLMVDYLLALAHVRGCTRLKMKTPFESQGRTFWEGFGLHPFGRDDHHVLFDVSLDGVTCGADLARVDSYAVPAPYLAKYPTTIKLFLP